MLRVIPLWEINYNLRQKNLQYLVLTLAILDRLVDLYV